MLASGDGSRRVSPFVGFVSRSRPGEPNRYGIYHRLTGVSFDTGAAVHALLRCSQATGASVDVGRLVRVDERLPQLLAEHRFTVESLGPEALLAPFRDWHLTLPVHNPAAVALAGPAGPAFYTLPQLSICYVPREAARPAVRRTALSPSAVAMLAAADALKALSSLDAALPDPAAVLDVLLMLTHADCQLVRAVADTATAHNPLAPHQFPLQSFVTTAPQQPAEYHYERAIADPGWNFDWLEPTVSHAFRCASAGFDGLAYGARFAERALADVPVVDPVEVLEIGGGTGAFASTFLAHTRGRAGGCRAIRYTIIDRSPALSQAQAVLLQGRGQAAATLVRDALAELPEGPPVHLAIVNEVIADLDVVPAEGRSRQLGADRLVALLAKRLAQGGIAVLTEYGSRHDAPERVGHLGHVEHSVEFAQIEASAWRHGLAPAILPLTDYLGARGDAPYLVGQQERLLCLAALFAEAGRKLEFRAYDRAEFEMRFGDILAQREVVGLTMSPLSSSLHYGPDIGQFWAAVLRKLSP